jgi:putative flippase GtrA
MKFTKKDLLFSIVTGLMAGYIGYAILSYLQTPNYAGISIAWAIVVVPILWIVGVNLGYILGRWLDFFNQFGRFVAVGFTNAAVDFGVMYLLLVMLDVSETTKGGTYFAWYGIIKGSSFLVAMLLSFIWNKYWVFGAGNSRSGGAELGRFIAVSVSAWLINIAVATSIASWVHPLFGITQNGWQGFSAIIASAVALAFSFTGYKLAVFRERIS